MEYLNTKKAADKRQISEQAVRRFCRLGRIPEAIREGTNWLIPDKARKLRKTTYFESN